MTTFEHPTELFPSAGDEDFLPEIVGPPGAPRAPARAWFLGEGEIPPAEEPTGDAGLEQMHQEASALPLLEDLRRALDLIGDGLPVKRNGDPYVRDIREFARRQGAPAYAYAYDRSSPSFTELVDLLGHPRIRDIPLDHETGHVSAAALTELAACRESMDRLEAWGLVAHEEMDEHRRDAGYSRYRAPLLMRGVLAGWA